MANVTVESRQQMPFPARPAPAAPETGSPPNIAMSPRGTPGHPSFARIAAVARAKHAVPEQPTHPKAPDESEDPAQVEPVARAPRPNVMEVAADTMPPVAAPKPVAEINSNYITITDLPSRFAFYTFKSLSIRTIRAPEQAKINRAIAESSLRHVVEAISATLEDGLSAYALTPADFRFLQYWHRMTSYTKVPYNHIDYCENVEHLEKVTNGELDAKTLEIQTILLKTDLQVKDINEVALTTTMMPDSLTNLGPYHLSICTMADVVQQLEFLDAIEKKHPEDRGLREEYEWMSDFAAFLGPKDVPIEKRVDGIRELSADQIQDLTDYIASISDYGVQESTTITCKVCGASKRSQISIDALSFLPTAQRAKPT